MPRLVCFFAFVLLLAGGVHSRDTIPNTDDMVRTAYPDFIPELYRYIDLIYASDLETARILCERLRTSALAVGSKEWKLEADFLEAGYLILHELVPPEVSLATYDSLFEDSRDVNMPIFRLHVLVGYFNLLWSTNDYENAFSLLREFKQLLEDVSTEDFFRKPHYFYRAGEAYYHFNDYSEAMKMLRPLVDLPMSATMKVPKFHSINMIGLIHQDRGVLDSAEYYFQRVLNLGIATGDSAWIGIASGNLGKNAFLRGDFEEAIRLMQLGSPINYTGAAGEVDFDGLGFNTATGLKQ